MAAVLVGEKSVNASLRWVLTARATSLAVLLFLCFQNRYRHGGFLYPIQPAAVLSNSEPRSFHLPVARFGTQLEGELVQLCYPCSPNGMAPGLKASEVLTGMRPPIPHAPDSMSSPPLPKEVNIKFSTC